tara:strand:- start:3150 stop:3329 length:180 start_codon:yes stop_codon:yes gene_type:complete
MKIFLTLFLFALLSGCSVVSLASTAVSTAAKIIEVPIKAIGKVVTRDDDEEEEKEAEEN